MCLILKNNSTQNQDRYSYKLNSLEVDIVFSVEEKESCEMEHEEESFKTAFPESCRDCRTTFKTPGSRFRFTFN